MRDVSAAGSRGASDTQAAPVEPAFCHRCGTHEAERRSPDSVDTSSIRIVSESNCRCHEAGRRVKSSDVRVGGPAIRCELVLGAVLMAVHQPRARGTVNHSDHRSSPAATTNGASADRTTWSRV